MARLVRVAPGDRIVEVGIPGQPNRLKLVRLLVEEAAALAGCSQELGKDLVLAVDEACQNVIRHTYGGASDAEIRLQVVRDLNGLLFLLRDFGPPVDPRQVRPRNLDEVRPGGLGTHFILSVMDEVRFEPPPDGVGNVLRMLKRL